MQVKRMHWVLALVAAAGLIASPQSEPAKVMMEAARKKEVVDGDLMGAIKQYAAIVSKYVKTDRAVTAMAMVRMAEAYQKMGDAEARKIFEQVVREYADQKEAATMAQARLHSASGAQAEGLTARRVWTNQLRFPEGFPSPDGRYITWVNSPGGGHLAIHDMVTGEDRDLTQEKRGEADTGGVFTPDGKQILYQWYDGVEDNWSFRLIGIDGSKPRVVAKISGTPGFVAPDGKTAAVTLRHNGAQQIALLDLASGKTTVLKSVEWRAPEIGNFSPDGKFIVYTLLAEQGSQDRDVYVLSVDGSTEFKLVAAPGVNRGAYFSPDGSHVAFTSNRSGRWDLWTIAVSGGRPQGAPVLLKADIGPVANLGFSRDGRFFFREQVDQSDAYVADIDPKTGIMRGAPRRISDRFIGSSAAPVWSPDGKQLAFVVDRVRAGQYQPTDITFVVANTDGSQPHEYNASFPVALFARFLRWFPDGQSLLLAQWNMSPKNRQFRRLDLQTGGIEPLFTTNWSNNLNTVISPDGADVYFAAPAPDDPRIKRFIRRRLATGEESNVFETKGGTGPAALHGVSSSPDLKQIAYFGGRKDGGSGWAILIAPLDGGSARQLQHPVDKAIIPNWSAWTSDGRGLLIVAGSGKNYFADPQELWYIPTDGGEPHKTGISMSILDSPVVHPDGDRIGFTGGTTTTHVWALGNVLSKARTSK